MKYSKYSTIIVGSGIAGLYAALKIEQQAKLPDGIMLITKSKLGESNSKYAQGGMVAVLKENKCDSTESHISDTIKAGAGLSEFNTVKFISENSDKVVKDLLNFGVEFDRDKDGNLCFTKEAAHSVRRILHSGGDATGKMIEKSLVEQVQNNNNIDVYEEGTVVELLINSNGECRGVLVFNNMTGEYETVYSPAVILATGGIGQLYKYTTNPEGATGDGLAIAYNAGAVMQDMEFVQFHPTALAFDDDVNRFLISEAVRGEGAKLVDADGMEFMAKYDERKELAPRDIVTRANYNEMMRNHLANVYLNASCIDKAKLAERFPTISKKCLEHGIDISKDFIPVAPAAHYFMGGIRTDVEGRTSINGLFAIGEVSSTGLHGGNRLASNSLLECVVCAYEVADFLKTQNLDAPKSIDANIKSIIDQYSEEDEDVEPIDTGVFKAELKDIMWNYCGILRDEKSLMTALEKLDELKSKFPRTRKCQTKAEYEFKNMLTVARMIVVSALGRKESRGAHYRLDYLKTSEECTHSHITKKEGELEFVK
ncbi:MAG: L-aspartate oxidase [Brachyspira sp.]|nr:L-aspartate oxidase [Brachyspira sp.]